MFPFKEADSVFVKVSFKLGENRLAVEKWQILNRSPLKGNL
jgi:hypothetical protein